MTSTPPRFKGVGPFSHILIHISHLDSLLLQEKACVRTQELQLGRDNAGRSGPFELPLTPPSPFKALYASINLERCEAGGFWPKFGGSAPKTF